ncbi:MAG: lysine exporter LysO family protein [Desulfurococcales archaeon]|nr:lysine exporter LysO family protein [Desulfurococcales archaeon]
MKLANYITVIVFFAGLLMGMGTPTPITNTLASLTNSLLLFLLFVAGYYLAFHLEEFYYGLRDPQVALLVSSTLIGGGLAGLLGSLVTSLPLRESLAVSIASGWYSFAGAYIGAYDPLGGLVAFVGNLVREALTLAIYPVLSRKDPLLGVTLGGATTMDTSLGIIARHAGPRIAGVAFAHGLIITLLISLLIPIIYP